MPGFEKGGFKLARFVSGINIVFGPNACGKSTAARALRALLWPTTAEKTDEISGVFEAGGRDWSVDVRNKSATFHIDRVSSNPPSIVAAEQSKSYYLSLKDLLKDQDEDLAKRISKEMVGGYDIPGAAKTLNFKISIPRTNFTERAELSKATSARDEKKGNLENLVQTASELDLLKQQRDAAKAAGKCAKLLETAEDYARNRDAFVEKQKIVDACDERLPNMSGSEMDDFDKLKGRLAKRKEQLISYEAESNESKAEITKAGLPEGGISETIIDELLHHVAEVSNIDKEVKRAQEHLAEADGRLDQRRKLIDEDITNERLEKIAKPGEWARYKEHARNTESLRGKRSAEESFQRLLAASRPENNVSCDTESINSGIHELHHWLEAGDTKPSIPFWLLIIFSLVGAVLGSIAPPELTVVVLIIGLIMAGIAFYFRKPSDSLRGQHESAYKRLSLEQPSIWQQQEVLELLRMLRGKLHSAEYASLLDRQYKQSQDKLDEIKIRADDLKKVSKELQTRLGVAEEDESGLALLAENVKEWQDALIEKSEAQASLEEKTNQRTKAIETINTTVEPYKVGACKDMASATALIKDLENRARKYREGQQKLQNIGEKIEIADKEIKGLEHEIKDLYERAGVHTGDEQELKRLIDEREDYLKKCSEKNASEAVAKDSEKTLTEACEKEPDIFFSLRVHDWQPAGDLSEAMKQLMSIPRDRIKDTRERQLEIANQYNKVNDQITKIETLVDEDKKSQEMEEALAAVEEARSKLRKHRDQTYAANAGAVLAEYITDQSQDKNSKVLKLACDYFHRITNKRYELQLNKDAFTARDLATLETKKLDELSDGTRVQLLLSVRLAFVENQEKGPKLPLFFDEALAITDDIRAPEVGQSIVEIAKTGRQVFYFTAQQDEIKKISECVNGGGISLETFTLNDSGSSNVLDNRAIVT